MKDIKEKAEMGNGNAAECGNPNPETMKAGEAQPPADGVKDTSPNADAFAKLSAMEFPEVQKSKVKMDDIPLVKTISDNFTKAIESWRDIANTLRNTLRQCNVERLGLLAEVLRLREENARIKDENARLRELLDGETDKCIDRVHAADDRLKEIKTLKDRIAEFQSDVDAIPQQEVDAVRLSGSLITLKFLERWRSADAAE